MTRPRSLLIGMAIVAIFGLSTPMAPASAADDASAPSVNAGVVCSFWPHLCGL